MKRLWAYFFIVLSCLLVAMSKAYVDFHEIRQKDRALAMQIKRTSVQTADHSHDSFHGTILKKLDQRFDLQIKKIKNHQKTQWKASGDCLSMTRFLTYFLSLKTKFLLKTIVLHKNNNKCDGTIEYYKKL